MAQPVDLNKYYTTAPEDEARFQGRWAKVHLIATLVSLVAAAAFACSVVIFSSLAGSDAYSPIKMAFASLCAGPGTLLASFFYRKREQCLAEHEKALAPGRFLLNELQKDAFLSNTKNEILDETTWARVAGRLNYAKKQFNETQAPPFSNEDAERVQQFAQLRTDCLSKILPNLIDAALMLHILKNPTYPLTKWSELGSFEIKPDSLLAFDSFLMPAKESEFAFFHLTQTAAEIKKISIAKNMLPFYPDHLPFDEVIKTLEGQLFPRATS